ncbi:helix-turn-helix domain-containing protein [Ruegeria sp. HKCCD7303]|uniref:helix-turn-helix transcriptional regulator n=1 Tax=Ruegeria sp. HKCCD7303 TaxID=2683013 RepID=UPI001492BD1D|nr:helix-turn-helix domain-containing protein [Ruegeria sp. HKCCD7303]
MPAEYLKDQEVADLLGIGKSTVWKYIHEGVLPKPVKIGGSTRWRRSEIFTHLEQQP